MRYFGILYLISYSLYLINIDRILFEFRKNDFHSILKPESFTFYSNTLLEVLVMLDSIGEFSTRIYTLAFNRVYHVVWTFIAESHSDSRLIIKNSKFCTRIIFNYES